MSDWSTLSDAAEAHVLYEHDLKAMAEEWERGRSHFKQFYRFAPERVRKMASTNSGGILAHAFIVGWSSENKPILIWEKIFFEDRSNPMVRSSSQVLTSQELRTRPTLLPSSFLKRILRKPKESVRHGNRNRKTSRLPIEAGGGSSSLSNRRTRTTRPSDHE